jgi:hypothetical protein
MVNPNFEQLVTDRLAAAGLDMGLKATWNVPPKRRIQQEELPCAYTLIGAVYQPVIRTQGQLSYGRMYVQRILLKPFDGSPDKMDAGNEAMLEVIEWSSKVHFYYHERPQLSTSTLPKLNGCKMVERTEDSGTVYRTAPGGATYTAIDVVLFVLMAASIQTVSIPY